MQASASPLARIVIATRESRLALWQAHHVQDLLRPLTGGEVALLGMTTQGDQILDRALSKVGGKGLFVKELEVALAEGRADLAVHSLKDVPMELPEGFVLAAVMEREDPRDALVSPQHASIDALPQGAVVGTSSLRRLVQLKALRPDLRIEPLRGNLDTRLRKLDEGQYDAIVLAAAGLKRLGLGDRIRAHIEPEQMLPAAGQGALGLEIRANDQALAQTVQSLAHLPTWLCCAAERAVSRALGGSCSMPLAAHATATPRATGGHELALRSLLGHAEEPGLRHAQETATVHSLAEAEALGLRVAQMLKDQAPAGWLPAC
ncbi:MAG: hypothetical protein RI907_2043 [Pseudomonadota bacterium]|jgi:hydroxymethylbilane synthase